MKMKKMLVDAAVIKAVTDALESSKKRRKPAAKKMKGLSKSVGKSMEDLTETFGKTVGGLTESAGKTVEGIGVVAGKTVESLGATLGKTAEGVSETVGKTVETTVDRTKEMTVGRVDEYRTQRRMAKLAKRRQKIRQQRMNQFGMYLGFALMAYLLYWWDQRRGRPIKEIASEAGQSLRKTTETVARTAQNVGSRASEQAGHLVQEAKTRLNAERGMEMEGNGHGAGFEAQETFGRSEVSAPGELRGASGPAVSPGMKVVAFDGVDIGRVQEVEEASFVLDRPRGSDLRVPQDAISRVEGTVVYLRVAADRVVKQGWERLSSD